MPDELTVRRFDKLIVPSKVEGQAHRPEQSRRKDLLLDVGLLTNVRLKTELSDLLKIEYIMGKKVVIINL